MNYFSRKFSIVCFGFFSLSFALISVHPAIAQPEPVGLWEFNDANNTSKETIGEELEIFGDDVSIDGINASDKAVTVPTGALYRVWHTMPANGGGDYVNQYTLVFDFRIPELGNWYSFFQTNADNSNDGDAFVNTTGNIGVGDTGYSVLAIEAGKWYRLSIAVDLAAGTINYYLDGNLIQSSTDQSLNNRFAIYTIDHDTPFFYILADNNGEDSDLDISTFMLFDRGLTADEVAALKGPLGVDVEPIDQTKPNKPVISIQGISALDDIPVTSSEFTSTSIEHARTTWEIALDVDFATIVSTIDSSTDLTSIQLDNGRFAMDTVYYIRALYTSSNGKNSEYSDPVSFELPHISGLKQLYSEDFESTASGSLPNGWKELNFSEPGGEAGYESWSVRSLDELNVLEYYPDYADNPPSIYDNVTPVVQGNSCHADSAAYGAPLFEAHLFSPVYDLSGVTNVYLLFNSDYFQNQDNIACLEYTIDGGDYDESGSVTGSWLPLAYLLEAADVTFDEQGNINAEETFHLDNVADDTGFAYIDFTLAHQSTPIADLAPFIIPQVEENRAENKRFERIRIPLADNQSSVRFRWTYMGTWSWYWGIDDVQIWGDDGTVTDIDYWSLY
ncbi:MAG: LamG domain-containing protein [candidate division Zixibacteria bacterium]|nr:LamG domain-containing protein [candidate division Zixibacteria bacterium]